MNKRERFLEWIAAKLPARIITSDCPDITGDYIRRYFIKSYSSRTPAIFLHHIMRSDLERALHDHPWSFISIVLTGSYREWTIHDFKDYRAGSILFRPAAWLHRLEIRQPMWTLVIAFKKERPWGFLTPEGWIHWSKMDYGKDC